MVHTGVKAEIPFGYVGLLKDRAALASMGLMTLGGVIDSGYRGEIKALLLNTGNETLKFNRGDRVVQLIVARIDSTFFFREVSLELRLTGEITVLVLLGSRTENTQLGGEMMGISYNKIVLVGRLTRDPEHKFAASGTQVSNFNLAVDKYYPKDADNTDFIRIVASEKPRSLSKNI